MKEARLPPRKGVIHPLRHVELLTYVREGALAYEDCTGQAGIIRAGEFQRVTATAGVRYMETNSSLVNPVHIFQLRLRSALGALEPSHERKRFSTAQRRGTLCVVASPDARQGSLQLNHDVVVYSAILDSGQHIAHLLQNRRAGWLHVVEGEIGIKDTSLSSGDGAGISAEPAISFTSQKPTEVLLIDLSTADRSF